MSEMGVERGALAGDGGSGVDRPAGRRRSDRIVGGGRATQDAVDQALTFARSDRPVWIIGAEGTGKNHLARAIHAWSPRSAEAFVTVSCGTLAEPLLSREVFGCVAGAHASLPEEHIGALARAGGGTVLLDAVDRAPKAFREALARAIATQRFKREGSSEDTALRARIFFATAERGSAPLGDLGQDVIELLPLSERREDVLPLAAHFLRLAADEIGIVPVGFTSDARNALLSEAWSGNVRELGERVRQAVKLAGNGAISAEALLLAADGDRVPSFKEAKRAFETRYVVGLLRRCGGNISHAARLAKKDRKDFYDVIRRTGVDPADFR